MKLPENLFSRSVLAYLPLTVYAFDIERACRAAFLIAIVSWISLLFFWFTRRLFPERFLKAAFFLWLLVWGQSVWTLMRLEPLWILSVFFLMPLSFLEKENKASKVRVFSKEVLRYFWERIVAGFGFVGFVLAVTGIQKGLELGGRGISFQQPAVTFLLIATLAVLWKNQPFRR